MAYKNMRKQSAHVQELHKIERTLREQKINSHIESITPAVFKKGGFFSRIFKPFKF